LSIPFPRVVSRPSRFDDGDLKRDCRGRREHNVYNTIRKKSLTWTQKLSDQLNLAHVAEKMKKKSKTPVPT